MNGTQKVELLLILGAAALLVVTQAALWVRSGRAAPQATWMAAFSQASALAVLALYLDRAGLRPVALVLLALALTAGLGLVSASRATHRTARANGTSWFAQHRKGLRSTVVAVEAVVAAVAVAMTVSWAADRFNGDFDGNADTTLCRLMGDTC